MNIIEMCVGLPGCGKSTWAKSVANFWRNVEVISTDSIREELYGNEAIQGDGKLVFDTAYQRIHSILEQYDGKRIIFDATNLHRRDRERFSKEFKNDNTLMRIVYFRTPYEVCVERNSNRERKVPVEVIQRMYERMDVPNLNEGFDEFEVVRK